ncbi:hypothetical protein [Thioclava sp. GXIMD2076]|uniref:hypothetical protein n=1 Tax=Thioclava sp. GXIMD2076 TaxID=3131931 RepID=UPI0030CA7D07
MPRKKNRRKEIQAQRRAEEVAKAPKPKPERRVGIIAHRHPSGPSIATLAMMISRLGRP